MILDNFKPLISFRTTGTFKNVLGNNVNKSDMLAGQQNNNIYNSHENKGSNLQYNYSATTASNSYTNEQTSYNWNYVVKYSGSGSEPQHWGNGFTLFVGSGTTAPTAQDYKLETPLTLDVVSASCVAQDNEKVSVIRTFQNNTESDVTVNEVGCYLFIIKGADTPVVMIGRKVLESGITIPSGDIYTFTYVIDMSNITLG